MSDTDNRDSRDSLEQEIAKLFGDDQAYDGGWFVLYDGKWLDMTNEICAVAKWHTAHSHNAEIDARIDELTNLRNHLLGNVYDKSDTSAVDNKVVIDKLTKRIEELTKEKGEQE